MSLARKTPIGEPYQADVKAFAVSLYPKLRNFFIDWCCTNFPIGTPIYTLQSTTLSDCYGSVHKSYTTCHPSVTKERITETKALSRWAKELKAQQASKTNRARAGEVRYAGRIAPESKLEDLLLTYTEQGVPWVQKWENTIAKISESIGVEVARAYIRDRYNDVTKFIGIKAASEKESAAIILCAALEGETVAKTALGQWSSILDRPLGEISILGIQGGQSEAAMEVNRKRNIYWHQLAEKKRELANEAQAVGLFKDEMETKFFKGKKSELYARMVLRLSPRNLALVAYAQRINCEPSLWAELKRPIDIELKEEMAELRARLQPMSIIWKTPTFKREEVV